jgi:hypothetical protein
MSLRVEIADAGQCLHMVGEGELTTAMLQEGLAGALEEPRPLRDIKYCFANYLRITSSDITFDGIQTIASVNREMARHKPDLIVVNAASENFAYGLGRMWEAVVEDLGWRTCTCRTWDEAADWVREQVRQLHGIEVNPPKAS